MDKWGLMASGRSPSFKQSWADSSSDALGHAKTMRPCMARKRTRHQERGFMTLRPLLYYLSAEAIPGFRVSFGRLLDLKICTSEKS